jgi:hypothetical protein
MLRILFMLTTLAVFTAGCHWAPTSVSAPSDGVVYAGLAKQGFFSAKGKIVRCDGPEACVELWKDD